MPYLYFLFLLSLPGFQSLTVSPSPTGDLVSITRTPTVTPTTTPPLTVSRTPSPSRTKTNSRTYTSTPVPEGPSTTSTPTFTPSPAAPGVPAAESTLEIDTKIAIGVGVGVGVGAVLGLSLACLFCGVSVENAPSKGVGFGNAYSALSSANIRSPSFSASGGSENKPFFGQWGGEGGANISVYGTS